MSNIELIEENEQFKDYLDIIDYPKDDSKSIKVNLGYGKRYNFLTQVLKDLKLVQDSNLNLIEYKYININEKLNLILETCNNYRIIFPYNSPLSFEYLIVLKLENKFKALRLSMNKIVIINPNSSIIIIPMKEDKKKDYMDFVSIEFGKTDFLNISLSLKL